MSGPYPVLVTGHRPDKLGGYTPNPTRERVRAWLGEQLDLLREEHPFLVAISGMALGVDTWFAEEALARGIALHAYLPFPEQDARWNAWDQAHYRALLQGAERVIVVSPSPYAAWKMLRRNEAMVADAALGLAVWDGSPGGTAHCVAKARARGLPLRFYPFPAPPLPPSSES